MGSLSDIMASTSQSLRVQQLLMQIIGENTANVNTDGYSRRRADLVTAPPFDGLGTWSPGWGVDVANVGRVRDELVDEQLRRNAGSYGYWNQRDEQLNSIESVFSDLNGTGISSQLQQFWAAWQDLSNHPEGMAGRTALIQATQALTSGVQNAYTQLSNQRDLVDRQVQSSVSEINTLTSQIAHLNTSIVSAELDGHEASELRDQRDIAIDRLSHIMNISVREESNGAVNVFNGGQIMVQRDRATQLAMSRETENGMVTVITYSDHGSRVQLDGGELKSLLTVRDDDLTTAMNKLDEFARSMSQRINDAHRTGYGLTGTNGMDFFANDVTGASNFRLSSMITDDPSRIATAAGPNATGDNSLALQIAGIQNEKFMNNGQSSLDDFYRDFVLDVGARKANSASQLKIEQGTMDNLTNRRQQISGVSMDEEMARMVQVQQAYQASAKVITVIDQMMQTVLAMGAA
jgi:flagellar hook-associated protein 1